MAKDKKEKKGGAGKFFLGALIGSIAGAVAGKFIRSDDAVPVEDDKCDCKEKCDNHKQKHEQKSKKDK